ncbi:MAG: DNA polymerase III subunit alpha [Candidatus Paceibacterota bacterium]
MSKFTHLHVHSHYSLLQALPKISDLVNKAKEDNMSALALTDAGNLYGAIEFYKECKNFNIKPIIGVDFYVAARTRTDREPRIDNKRTRLVLLVKNAVGYQNLIQLVTLSNLEGFYYKPRLDRELIEKYSEGLVAISPAWGGDISTALRNSNEEKAEDWADFLAKTFKDDFYLEITKHPEIEDHDEVMKRLENFAKNKNIKIVASADVYYIEPEDKQARNTLMQVQRTFGGRSAEDDDGDFSFISSAQAEKLFKDMPEALKNNEEIVEKCNIEIELGKWVFPDIKIVSGLAADDELKRLVYEGFAKRNVEQNTETVTRAEYELGIIRNKGYGPYFLVVADLLRFAKENNILSNIRGSVSGSLVTFLSGITNINPLEYEIPFERFLNPDRPSPPDIDMDYADNRRDEVVAYAKRKYGAEKVAQIGTFGTMAARGSVRDIARALGYPVAIGDRISKTIPMGSQGFPMTIERALVETKELKEMYDKEEDTKKIIDMAQKIEGCARHISVHAAGVVMAPTNLTDFTPLQFDTKGESKIITQYDMYSIEEAGLLKFDFLGLKNLSIIADTIKLVEKLKGIKIDYENIPIDDKKTYEMLARGETSDTFQLNGEGMTRFLVELKPTSIHDINAMVALYRPGPMQFIPLYIERKHNPSLITYLDPALEEILKKTYGVLVYQDDLLMIAHNISGYTWDEVDKFRKAVGKKIPAEMAKQKKHFIEGAVKHSGWSQKKATELWAWIEPFAAYGFNKAHSVSYGRVAYITAYLKANFPAEYMSAVLTHESGDVDKVSESVNECKRMNIKVLAPSINESFEMFTVVKDPEGIEEIRFGLNSIKNFGEGISGVIIEEREKGGKFKSLEDILLRVGDRNLNKKSLEALIKSGSLEEFGERGYLLGNLENILAFYKESHGQIKNQVSLFGSNDGTIQMVDCEIATATEKLAWEKDLLGLFISGHPLDRIREKLIQKEISIEKTKSAKDGTKVLIIGIPAEIKEVRTKKGDLMAFMKVSDYTSSMEVVVFSTIYEGIKGKITPEKCLAIEGKISMRNGTQSIVADKIRSV